MGGSGWSYIVPYQANIQQALQTLRQNEFASLPDQGRHFLVEEVASLYRTLYPQKDEEELDDVLERYVQGEDILVRDVLIEPPTFHDIVERFRPDSSKSILDVSVVSHESRRETLSPFPYDAMYDFFGTWTPTREHIQRYVPGRWKWENTNLIWEKDAIYSNALHKVFNVYIPVYAHEQDTEPGEWFFLGREGWSYFVPYQHDVEQALQTLRAHVFETKAYSHLPLIGERKLVLKWLFHKVLSFEEQSRILAESATHPWHIPEAVITSPQDVDHLNLLSSGNTHSIMDVDCVTGYPMYGAFTPMPSNELMYYFGTVAPTRDHVQQDPSWGLDYKLPRRQGIYIILYQDGQPHEIYFTGWSGF